MNNNVRNGIIILLVVAILGGGGFYLFGPCGYVPVTNSAQKMSDLLDQFSDAVQVASSTPRIGLAGPIGDMQETLSEISKFM